MALAAAIGALVTGAGWWVTWASSIQTKAEVIELIETRSPYLYEQKLILSQLQEIRELRKEVQELKEMVQAYFEGNANGPPRANGAY